MEAILVGMYGLVVGIVVLGNSRDKDINIGFIRHTLAADTIFANSKLKKWAIKSEAVVLLAFRLVVLTEIAIAVFCLVGAYFMWLGDPPIFAQLGLGLAVLLWFGGFRGIGELLGMWQSKEFNALPDSFHMAAMAMLILILVS